MEEKIVSQHSQRGEVLKNSNHESYKTATFCKCRSEHISPSALVNCIILGCICQYINVTINQLIETGRLQNPRVREMSTSNRIQFGCKCIHFHLEATTQSNLNCNSEMLEHSEGFNLQKHQMSLQLYFHSSPNCCVRSHLKAQGSLRIFLMLTLILPGHQLYSSVLFFTSFLLRGFKALS